MKIFRYSEAVQKQIGSKTKPEPWLHCIIAKQRRDFSYAIYVWDTRQIVEQGQCNGGITGQPAFDNHQPLRGDGSDRFDMSDAGRDERLKARCRKAWADYVDARDAYWHNAERKSTTVAHRQHEAMMRKVRKLGDIGLANNIPEWAQYVGRFAMFRDETVQCPRWIFD